MSLADSQFGDDGLPLHGPRLPSTRPIGRRWNHSRGIILSNAKRNARGNFTWSRGDGIVFSDLPASRRHYASRRVFQDQSNAPQPSTQTARGSDLVNNPHKISSGAIPSQNLHESLKREQLAHKDTERRLKNKMEQISGEFEEEMKQIKRRFEEKIKQIRGEVEVQKAELVAENKAVLKADFENERRAHRENSEKNLIAEKKAESELKRNAERTLELEKRERELNAMQSSLESKKQELDNTIATAYREAEAAAKNQYESVTASAEELLKETQTKRKTLEKLEEDAASEAKEQQQQFSAAIDRLTSEASRDRKQHQKTLNQAAADRVVLEIADLKESLALRHDVGRADYEAYHSQWDRVGDEMFFYAQETGRLADRLDRIKADRWKASIRSFNRWKDDPRLSDRGKESPQTDYDTPKLDTSFSQSYPSLSRQLEQFLQSSAEEALKTANDLRDLRDAVLDARTTLNLEAHFSRKLTNYHHFEEGSTMYSKMSLIPAILNEDPLTREQNRLKAKRDSFQQRVKAAAIGSNKESLRQEVQRHTSMIAQISKLKDFFRYFRNVEALDALSHDDISEKAIFAVTQQARDSQEEAWSNWSQSIDEQKGGRTGEQLQSDRKEFRELYTKARNERDNLARLIRKRTLLEENLGEITDGTVHDAAIEKELNEARRDLDQQLERMARSGGGSSAFVRQPVAPRMPAVKPTSPVRKIESLTEPPSKIDTRSLAALDTEIGALKRRLKESKAYEGAEQKEKDERKLIHLKTLVLQHQIDIGTKKKAELLRKAPGDHAAALGMQKAIDSKTASLAKWLNSAETRNKKKDEVSKRPQAPTGRPLAPKDRTSGRGRLQIRKHNSEKGPRRSLPAAPDAATASSKTDQGVSASGVMGFKPTGAMQTSSPYWSADARSHSAASLNSGSARSASPSAQSSRGSSLASDRQAGLSQAIRQLSLESSRAEPQQHVDVNISRPFGFFSSNDVKSSSELRSNESSNMTDKFVDLDLYTSSARSSDDDPSNQDFSPDHSSATPTEDSIQDSLDAEQGDNADMEVALAYRMSPEDYRKALFASKNTNAAFWSYKLYKNPNGKSPLVFYCVNYDTAEARAREFLNEQVIGFDMEWEPFAKRGKSTLKQNVSLIQIAAEDKIGLFHIALFNGETPEELVPPSLRAILESHRVAKAGVNISGDATRLRQHLNVDMRGIFEISHLYRIVELKPSQVNKRAVKLSEQVQKVLGLPLMKGSVQTSAWSKKLHLEQTEYAASDSYAGFRLYHALEAKRKSMKPIPPRPAFWEAHQPLRLGDGSLIIPRPMHATRAKRELPEDIEDEAKEDDDECEEYFDTAEEVDADRVEPHATQESFQSYASSDESFVSLSESEGPSDADEAFEDQPQWSQHASQTTPSQPTKSDTHHRRPAKQSRSTIHPEVSRADLWVASWRASLPVEYNLQVGNSKLRAYHMWHEQGLGCYDVAALLRDPPLAPYTIASYVMEALKVEDLPFDAERVKEPLGILPRSVHGRYRKVLEKIGGLNERD